MVKLIIGGDICATKRDENAFLEGDALQLFNDLLPEIQATDFAIANLETPLITESSPIKKSGAVFGNSPKILNAIKQSGITFLNLANNHILDHGDKGLNSTLKTLKDQNFQYSGAGESLVDASQPFTTTIRRTRSPDARLPAVTRRPVGCSMSRRRWSAPRPAACSPRGGA